MTWRLKQLELEKTIEKTRENWRKLEKTIEKTMEKTGENWRSETTQQLQTRSSTAAPRPGVKKMMRVAPLFETREDLINAPKVIDAALSVQWYKDHVEVRGGLGFGGRYPLVNGG